MVEVSPPLLEAMDISGDAGKIDYFRLLGLERGACGLPDVERAVMARSKLLRPWQNSPQHGQETVKLLPMLHRIASVLKDPVRREAYEKELDRLLSGEKADPLIEFAEMARAAFAGGVIDQKSKAELLRYAATHGIAMNEAGRILNEITAVAPMKRDASAEEMEKAWEFRLSSSEAGPEAFRDAVSSMIETGIFGPETSARMVEDAQKFQIDKSTASMIMRNLAADNFKAMIKQVARGGVLNDNQAKLLMPKALGLGLDAGRAYEILSDYTFTGASQEDLSNLQLTAASFDSGEIDQFLAKQKTVLYRNRGNIITSILGGLFTTIPGLAILAIAVIAGAIYFGRDLFSSSSGIPDMSNVVTPGIGTPSGGSGTKSPEKGPWDSPKSDPANGLLRIAPETANDPPAFQVKITEVTCAEYQKFLKALFYPNRPVGWGLDYSFPAGQGDLPVTGISWDDAMAYCKYEGKQMNLPADKVRLLSAVEYARLLRAPLRDGIKVGAPSLWKSLGFSGQSQLEVSRKVKGSDTLYFSSGQIYNLLGNAREWGADEQGTKRIVLGGDYTVKDDNFDPSRSKWEEHNSSSPVIGFRYIVLD
ncbi:SUMF1/EgtB/PvdO family nonheme iron enzyme [Candidatus Sumerlaeota bacterium]|nr:SUMF1/EgtB/PvdO family nonheme iron enzyme [Candidatus Sumerlaeota bacterium]